MKLLELLEQVLGNSYKLKSGEISFNCKFCNHYKKKLQVNLDTQKWHCWVCNTGGHNLVQLFKKLQVSRNQFNQLYDIVNTNFYTSQDKSDEISEKVLLPIEFKSLIYNSKNMVYKHSIKYLNSRGISSTDIIKYNIGYCDNGIYRNRIIIPSYDKYGDLNYFVARDVFPNSTMKYKNPPVSRDIIPFELFVSWEHPVVLCEGVFDAIAIKRNAIPLLGKVPSKKLIMKIMESGVKDIYIALDNDAKEDALKLSQFMMGYGKNVYLVDMSEGDPSSVGFGSFWKIAEVSTSTKFSDIIRGRLCE